MSELALHNQPPAPDTGQISPQEAAQTPHESEAILHSFYESAPMVMGVVEVLDDDILHLSGNAAAARFMGATPEAVKFRLASTMGVPRERIREWISRYQATISAKIPIRFEYQSPAEQGARWMAATVSFIAYAETGRARCSYIIEDITVQKQALLDQQVVSTLHEQRARLAMEAARIAQTAQAEATQKQAAQQALRDSERRYRFMAESIPQIVWTADAEGGLDYYNRRWTEYTGLTLEQTINGGLQEIFYPDDLLPSFDAWREFLQTGHPYAMEHRIRGTDGLYRWFLTRAVAMRDGDDRVVKWFGTATDIDAQKRAAERERLLGNLGERLRATNDPQEVLWATVSMVGEHLQTSRCYYTDTDVDADRAVIHRDYCRGVESWAGTYRLSDFGGDVLVELGQGKTVSIADTKTDPRTAAQYETTYLPTNIRAYLAVPLMQNGKRVASLVVTLR